ncbi:MAG: hypothetical protein LBT33_05150, partial [Spirochaetia bacterium]|nr:hypothetical protein [Spirochaetia bacterium]
ERIARLVVFLYPLRGYKNTARPCNLGWSHPFGMLLAHATRVFCAWGRKKCAKMINAIEKSKRRCPGFFILPLAFFPAISYN